MVTGVTSWPISCSLSLNNNNNKKKKKGGVMINLFCPINTEMSVTVKQISLSHFLRDHWSDFLKTCLSCYCCCCWWCFTALRHFSGNFGRGQLTYPHCSWAILLGSLPVLSEHSFASKAKRNYMSVSDFSSEKKKKKKKN